MAVGISILALVITIFLLFFIFVDSICVIEALINRRGDRVLVSQSISLLLAFLNGTNSFE